MKEYIRVRHIHKRYGNREVIKDISFTIEKGEVFGLLGHNGAGKSTTINCILGLTSLDKGEVSLLGKDPRHHRKELFEHIGVQLQHSTFQNTIKVYELCEEMSALYQSPVAYEPLLKTFRLDSFSHHRVERLSGGEKQKLSIVIALLSSPDIIFLDELTTGLDVSARREVWNILKQLKEEGVTIVLTTHYMEEAQILCDHVMILKEGRALQKGSVEELIAKSPYDSLEDAYLWYCDEEVNL